MFRTFYILSLFLAASILSYHVDYSQNTFNRYKDWITQKRMSAIGITGADEFLIERSSLAQNRLNLGVFYAHQEVILLKEMKIRNVEFSFKLQEKSYLQFLIRKPNNLFWGLRIYDDPSKKSFAFIRNNDGEFLQKESVVLKGISSSDNNISLQVNDNKILVSLNDQLAVVAPLTQNLDGRIGFRGSHGNVSVDDIKVFGFDDLIYEESFNDSSDLTLLILIHFILLLFFFEFVYYLILRLWPRFEKVNLRLSKVIVMFEMLIIFSMSFIFDFYYWSPKDFYTNSVALSPNDEIEVPLAEKIRSTLFNKWYSVLNINGNSDNLLINTNYPTELYFSEPFLCADSTDCKVYDENDLSQLSFDSACKKILFFGTSQTYGAGATEINKSMFAKANYFLKAKSRFKCLIALNVSRSGEKIVDVLSYYQNNFSNFNPDFLVVNISMNDTPETLKYSLPVLKRFVQTGNIKSLLVKEAMIGMEHVFRSGLIYKHNILEDIVDNKIIFITNLDSYLRSFYQNQTGDIWWDYVHMTDYGHSIAGKFIADEILRLDF